MLGARGLKTRDLAFIGVLSAMCAVATAVKIPLGVGAMVHLGTAFLYIAGILYGGVYAGFAGAIGSGLYDLIMGFSPYTLWSFVIKGIAGLIIGVVAKGMWPESGVQKSSAGKVFLACLLAAAWTVFGYVFAWWQIIGSLTVALTNIPSSLLTSGIGMIVALFLAPKLRNVI
ncbi:putative membrane protein [Propionispora sp. 2/2-37]|uniref:ECF transporter S component n=1 Tax=Propionispora sp. 2/2-37 TaxID=1677858 RepID=UPI0006BB7024|nr:ECF transporter S component [Propionispora sp. 2/2-37]CUH94908.1 putative membrane protein [Propionispora sp. 2/2-37]